MGDPTEPCPHKVLHITDDDYERSEATCDDCGVRMKNTAETGWAPVANMAVETEDEPLCRCSHPKSIHQKDLGFCMDPAPFHRTCRCNGFAPAPSPISDVVSIPAEKIAALREAFNSPINEAGQNVYLAARAVVDAVETELIHNHVPGVTSTACPACKASQEDGVSAPETRQGGFYPSVDPPASVGAPSPARDDAEKAIAGLLAEHRNIGRGTCSCGVPADRAYVSGAENHRTHLASVIAAHMAAPDELTALREKADWDEWACEGNQELFRQARDECDALRERLAQAEAANTALKNDQSAQLLMDSLSEAKRQRDELRADLEVQQKQNKELAAERDALRERIRALLDQHQDWRHKSDDRGYVWGHLNAALGDA